MLRRCNKYILFKVYHSGFKFRPALWEAVAAGGVGPLSRPNHCGGVAVQLAESPRQSTSQLRLLNVLFLVVDVR